MRLLNNKLTLAIPPLTENWCKAIIIAIILLTYQLYAPIMFRNSPYKYIRAIATFAPVEKQDFHHHSMYNMRLINSCLTSRSGVQEKVHAWRE